MRLLLDECVPRPLKQDLIGHDVWHVVDKNWSSKRNGELLQLMVADHFAAFLTVDRTLEFQQDLQNSGVSVIVVIARTNRVKDLRPLVPQILDALDRVTVGQVIHIGR